jgi:Arc/MetJ family transcription regulator
MGEQVKVDEDLLAKALKATGEIDRERVVEQALQELIRRHGKVRALMDIAGTIQFYDGYDYKALRKSRYDAP